MSTAPIRSVPGHVSLSRLATNDPVATRLYHAPSDDQKRPTRQHLLVLLAGSPTQRPAQDRDSRSGPTRPSRLVDESLWRSLCQQRSVVHGSSPERDNPVGRNHRHTSDPDAFRHRPQRTSQRSRSNSRISHPLKCHSNVLFGSRIDSRAGQQRSGPQLTGSRLRPLRAADPQRHSRHLGPSARLEGDTFVQ